jgi:hypothetical protein
MALTEYQIIAEVGSTAWDKLTDTEKAAVLSLAGNSASTAGMRVFELLWKKFRPTYKMGKLYEKDSEMYEQYYKMYCLYARSTGAGSVYDPDNNRTVPDPDQWRDLLDD